MLSALISSTRSSPAMPLALQQVHQRCVHSGPLVLGAGFLKSAAPTEDRDKTVSRRFKPSSRTSLNGEQPYPWDRLQPQDEMSRHRGAKHRRRYELLGGISLLSPEYLLSVERWDYITNKINYDLDEQRSKRDELLSERQLIQSTNKYENEDDREKDLANNQREIDKVDRSIRSLETVQGEATEALNKATNYLGLLNQ